MSHFGDIKYSIDLLNTILDELKPGIYGRPDRAIRLIGAKHLAEILNVDLNKNFQNLSVEHSSYLDSEMEMVFEKIKVLETVN